jgi:DNA-binding response OmpR family regulator
VTDRVDQSAGCGEVPQCLRDIGFAQGQAVAGRTAVADPAIGVYEGLWRAQLTDGHKYFVLVSNVMTSTDDQVRGLNDGADGYIIRPIENRELLARVKAMLRIAATERRYQEVIVELKKQTGENNSLIASLEAFNRAAVGRELRMIELKQEINALCRELGREAPYSTQADS